MVLPSRTQKWIVALMSGLDENVDEETIAKILEQCGRQCQTNALIKKAKRIYEETGSPDKFIEKFSRVYKHLHKEGENVYITYPRCYCSQVNKVPKGKISGTYCNCSRGWVKALFEGATGKPVDVKMEESIINGNDECRFRVMM